MRAHRNSLCLICLLVALSLLGGCTGLAPYATVAPPQLTPAEEVRVWGTVEGKLIQMLGGPYHAKDLASDLSRLIQSNPSFKVSVADWGAPALYPLPGGRVIITRGLLAQVNSSTKLKSLLKHAMHLSNDAYNDRSTRSMAKATEELLSASDSTYDP